MKHFVDGYSEDVAIDHGDAREFIVLCVPTNGLVNGLLMLDGALDKLVGESTGTRAQSAKFVIGRKVAISVQVAKVEVLDGRFAALSSNAQSDLLDAQGEVAKSAGDRNRRAGCLGPAVEFLSEATRFGLFFVVEQEDLMNDWNSELQREIHEGSCDASRDQFRVRCLAAQDNSKRKDGIDFLLHCDKLHCQRDFKRARNPHEVDIRAGFDFA